MRSSTRAVLVLAALALAAPAAAFHRQTAEVVALTLSGDTPLPRVAAPGGKTLTLAVQSGAARRIVSLSPWRDRQNPALQTTIAEAGDHANPVVSATGRAFAFDSGSDPLGSGLPGRQVIGVLKSQLFGVSEDPSGVSSNPSIDKSGKFVAFESLADLAGTGQAGVSQVFVRNRAGNITQLSRGFGASRNVVLSSKHQLAIFESSSEPTTGADTGIAQIWVGSLIAGGATPITAGFGPSRNAAVSNDGRLVAFESTADLAGTQADTGVAQVFVYDTKSATFARITNEPGGCSLPSVFKVHHDWRVAYVCSGQPYFTMLREDQRYLVPASNGVTQRVITELDIHFIVLSTTADLLAGSGTTPGNQVYLVNLFKRPAVPVAGETRWFPSQGIPPL